MSIAINSPLRAMTWQIWRAQRWGITASLAYLLFAAIVAQYLPSQLANSPWGIDALPHAGKNLIGPCYLILVYLLAIFSVTGSADFQEKGYAANLLVLPISTRMLAIWPMILGCASLAAFWLVVAVGILRPTNNPAPMVWPIAALAVLLTTLQTVSWTPMVQSWLRMVIALPALVLPTAGVVYVLTFQVSEWIATVAFLAVLPLTACACLRGVAMARRGDAVEWLAASRILDRMAAWRKPAARPFASIDAAQFWYEFRLYGRMLPFAVLLVTPMFLTMHFVLHKDEVERVWRFVQMMFCAPVLFAATISAQAGNVEFPFLATRPISVRQLMGAKVKVALASASLCAAITLLFLPTFLLRPAVWESMTKTLSAMGPATATLVIVAVILGPPLLTWRLIVENFWLGLAGRPWFTNACVLGAATLVGIATLVGVWLFTRQDLHEGLKATVPWILVALAAVKLGLGVWVLRELFLQKLARTQTLVVLLGLWLLVFVGMSSFLTLQLAELPIGVPLILSAVFVSLPLNRHALAPLMFAWNRHR